MTNIIFIIFIILSLSTHAVDINITILPDVKLPNGISNVIFPAGFAPFNPPVMDIGVHELAPKISEWTESNDPGDTMAFTGENIDD